MGKCNRTENEKGWPPQVIQNGLRTGRIPVKCIPWTLQIDWMISSFSFGKAMGDLGFARDETKGVDPYYEEREWRKCYLI
jgi:hypothetical protein